MAKWFHADHGLTEAHKTFVESFLDSKSGFVCEAVPLPPELPPLPCGLYGPSMGDWPVVNNIREYKVTWKRRGDRPGLSRMVQLPSRPVRSVVIIGMAGDEPQIYTAYGGTVVAPREITDPTIPPEAADESIQFWSVHALASE